MCRCNMILNENITIDMFLGDRSIHIHLFNIYINVFLLWKLSQSHVFPTETLDLLRVLCLYFFGGLIRRSFCSHPGVILQLLGDFQLKKWSFNGRLLWDIMGYIYIYLLVFFGTVCVWKWGDPTPQRTVVFRGNVIMTLGSGLEWPPTGKRWETSDPGAFQPAGPTIP